MQQQINELNKRLEKAISDAETRLRNLGDEQHHLKSLIARMKDTKEKLHAMIWAESDAETVENLDKPKPNDIPF